MKHFLAPAALVLALSATLAFAQQPPAPIERQAPTDQTQMQPQGRHMGKHHGQRNPEKEAKHISKALNLNADQSAKLEPILADRQQKIAALQANTSLTDKDRKQQMRAIHQDAEQQLSGILTPDQVQQMKSMHKGHGRKGAEPLNPAPAV